MSSARPPVVDDLFGGGKAPPPAERSEGLALVLVLSVATTLLATLSGLLFVIVFLGAPSLPTAVTQSALAGWITIGLLGVHTLAAPAGLASLYVWYRVGEEIGRARALYIPAPASGARLALMVVGAGIPMLCLSAAIAAQAMGVPAGLAWGGMAMYTVLLWSSAGRTLKPSPKGDPASAIVSLRAIALVWLAALAPATLAFMLLYGQLLARLNPPTP